MCVRRARRDDHRPRRFRPWILRVVTTATLTAVFTQTSTARGDEVDVTLPSRLVSSDQTPASVATVTLRKFPYPYRAMLSIASDADGLTLSKFMLIHRYLNTDEHTLLGKGLGLDIADSYFFFIGTDRPGFCDSYGTRWADQMSYFSRLSTTDLHNAKAIQVFVHGGWIDSLHSLGDFSMQNEKNTRFARRFAVTAVNEMKVNRLALDIWINHGNRSNVGNFGDPESTYQKGDLSESKYYVSDLMVPAGIHFIWTRRDSDFGRKAMLYPIVLRDGRRVWGFYRFTDDGYSDKGQVLWNWSPLKLGEQLSAVHLQELEKSGSYSIIAQHLGGDAAKLPFYGDNLEGLVRLMREYRAGRLLVTRTSRLLHYELAQRFLQYSVDVKGGRVGIHAREIADPVLGHHVPTLAELRGITFYTAHPARTDLYIGNTLVAPTETVRNPRDQTGSASIGVRWWPAQTGDLTHVLPEKLQMPSHRTGPPTPMPRVWQEDSSWGSN
ncbi:MAG: hypothetical protein OWT28_03815 [Firmicutes bacterium]|nr:hypothetical protein [Bacillota bacterium]